MADSVPDWLAAVPAVLRPHLLRAADGTAPNVGLMHILMQCSSQGEAEEALDFAIGRLHRAGDQGAGARLQAVRELARANPDAFGIVRSVIDGLDHETGSGLERLAYWAEAFDRAVRKNPSASVALYALGNPELLRAATDEIVARLDEWGVLSPEVACLDLGCGTGRLELALAPRLRRIVGVDIAPAMVEQARTDCAGLYNVEFRVVAGRDLSDFPDRSFGLVVAVDSFPYLVEAGPELTATMLAEIERVLLRGGDLVILNFSYHGDLERDRADLAPLAERLGFEVTRNGTAEFRLWDGTSFVLRKR